MRRVLFVDDDPLILEGLERMLFMVPDWETEYVSSGADALEALERSPFDAVVTDMRMPGMDGASLLGHVLERHPSVIRIVLSGHIEPDAVMRTAPVAQQFLTKPCDPDSLCEAVERACGLHALLAEERLRGAVGRIQHPPPHPRIYTALVQALSRAETSVSDVADIVEQDPALAVRVLQLVNSAFVGAPHRTASIEDAVSYIGFNLLKSLVAYQEVVGALEDDPGSCHPAEQIHPITTAVVARMLRTGAAHTEDAFTAGLFHDVGRLILRTSFPDDWRSIADGTSRRSLDDAERESFGATGAEVGAYLLGLWGFSLPTVEAVAHHVEPWRLGTRKLDLPGVLHIACRLAREQTLLSEPLEEDTQRYLAELGLETRLASWRLKVQEISCGIGDLAA